MLNSGSLCLSETIQNPLIAKRPSTFQCKGSHKSPELNSEPSRGKREQNPETKSFQKIFIKLNQSQVPKCPHQPTSPLPCPLSKDTKKEVNLDPHPIAGGPSANMPVFAHPGLRFLPRCPSHFSGPALWNPRAWGRNAV